MPSANGVYSLPPGYLATTGSTILASQHNPPLEDIGAALTLRLSRDGAAPMTGPLQLAAGTVTAPGAVFSTDPTSGWFKTTNGIGLAVGGTLAMEVTAAGIASGSRLLGEIVPWPWLSVPNPLWVFPFGQTLSRTTYLKMWVKAQTEIAAGNTFFNNGDGSTTFGIGDLRSYVIQSADNMGAVGSASGASRTNLAFGNKTGEQNHTLQQFELPNVALGVNVSGTINVQSTFGGITGNQVFGFAEHVTNIGVAFPIQSQVVSSSGFNTMTGVTTALGTGAAHNNMQPTIALYTIMFVGN